MVEQIGIPVRDVRLNAVLTIPDTCIGIVVVAHGSGSDRRAARNVALSRALNEAGFATLLVDLLAPGEEAFDPDTLQVSFAANVFSERLIAAVDWVQGRNDVGQLGIGIYGASTAAAAALTAAAQRPKLVDAVVSRGVGLDLAERALGRIEAPTLFIVGGSDENVLALNRTVSSQIRAETKVEVVPEATYLLETPVSLEYVASRVTEWFRRHLGTTAPLPILGETEAG